MGYLVLISVIFSLSCLQGSQANKKLFKKIDDKLDTIIRGLDSGFYNKNSLGLKLNKDKI